MTAAVHAAGAIAHGDVLDAPVDYWRVAVSCAQPGAGRTRACWGMGTALALHRREQVTSLDLAPPSGHLALAAAVGAEHPRTAADLLAGAPRIHTATNFRHYTSIAASRFETIAAAPQDLALDQIDTLMQVMMTFRNLAILDTGADLDHPHLEGVSLAVDALVIPVRLDAPDSLALTLATLAWWNHHLSKGWLLGRNAVVAARRPAHLTPAFLAFEQHFLQQVQGHVRVIVPIPHDPALDVTGPTAWLALRPDTRAAYTHLALEVARGFPRSRAGASR